MGIVRRVTSHTFLWRTLIHAIFVTCRAWNTCVPTRKWEAGPAVIEIHILPVTRVMTGTTIVPKLSTVRIVRGMTGKTIRWCSLINTVDMTGRACHVFMTSDQREACLAVIEVHILPVSRVMTFGTVIAHLSLMDISMAGCTGGWRICEG